MRYLFLILMFCLPLKGISQAPFEQKGLDWLKRVMASESDTIYVINFWATWCLPCVEEFPEFENFRKQTTNPLVRFIFISLDAPKTASKKMSAFLTKKKVPGDIVIMNAPDYNSWIDLVDKSWQGSLPATLITRGSDHKRWFVEKTISATELTEVSQQFYVP